jgi:hypothetical protein
MICPKHGIDEMECDCPHWSQEAVREFKARQQQALIPKRLQKGSAPMVDISALADKIVALINSKPSSPRRDEIVSILMAGIAKPQIPPGLFIEMSGQRTTAEILTAMGEIDAEIALLGPNPGFIGSKVD